jgi:mycofactocin precursor
MNDEMISEVATAVTDATVAANSEEVSSSTMIIDELLIEEISIDGMCGVY